MRAGPPKVGQKVTLVQGDALVVLHWAEPVGAQRKYGLEGSQSERASVEGAVCVCLHTRTDWCDLSGFKGQYRRGDIWVFSFLMFFFPNHLSLPSNYSLTHTFKAVLLINFPALGNLTHAPCCEPGCISRAWPV